jgi:hypothetical protein
MSAGDVATGRALPRSRLRPGSAAEALLHIGLAMVLLGIAVASFLVSTAFGIAVSFVLTLGLAISMPSAMPVAIICSFLFQNLVVAMFSPMVAGDEGFDTARGVNFVILMTTYGAFLLASFQHRARYLSRLRPWLVLGLALLAVVGVYFALGAVAGNPRDALVYFRNTVTPLACFHIAIVAASLYRIELERSLAWVVGVAVIYGYCELFFTLDFLSLFNGDDYIRLQMARQIETGAWEKALAETGYVLRGLEDMMMTSFFNTPLFGELFPRVFRIGGPNFHPIAFAYALSILSAWLLFQGHRLLPLAALPLLLVIGSKGAMALLLLAWGARLASRFVSGRAVTALVAVAAVGWIAAALAIGTAGADYHVLGFYAGIAGFLDRPLGQGLGIGGNLSSTTDVHLDWNLSQEAGVANVPVESGVGVMIYQMGVGSFVFFGFLAAVALKCRRLFLDSGDQLFLFGFVTVCTISVNAVLQEEAFYSPLALGSCLLLVGVALGSRWREEAAARTGAR